MTTETATQRLERSLHHISDPTGEGRRAFLTVYEKTARAEAAAADARAAGGTRRGPLDGVIVSIKDLFDVAGETTRSGSRVHADRPAAKTTAPIVMRLRAAGAVIVGKTNMTEFAYSGIGMNPHYGTPGNPFDRRHAPGGSSSGAAVAAADGMCELSIGSDTGGSTRIPAAFCGIVGFKPTQRRIPRDGAFPLSPTLDTVGPLSRSLLLCAHADAVMAGEAPKPVKATSLSGLRLGVLQGRVLAELDAVVARDFSGALARLAAAGARLVEVETSLMDDLLEVVGRVNFPAVEGHVALRDVLDARGDQIDPIVRMRIGLGRDLKAIDYLWMHQRRAELLAAFDAFVAGFDALVLPTTPIVAPRLSDLTEFDTFVKVNALTLRNTSIANFYDCPSISLPMHPPGTPPTGFMLFGPRMADRRLFEVAAGVEKGLGG